MSNDKSDDARDDGVKKIEDAVGQYVRDNIEVLAVEGDVVFGLVHDVVNKTFSKNGDEPMTVRERVIAQAIVHHLVVKSSALALGAGISAAEGLLDQRKGAETP